MEVLQTTPRNWFKYRSSKITNVADTSHVIFNLILNFLIANSDWNKFDFVLQQKLPQANISKYFERDTRNKM